MICYAPDPGLAGLVALEYGVPEADPRPSRAEMWLGLICLGVTALLLGAL
ncbi:MAG: hypothetical protein H5U15_11365 [Roseovarius sp.]|jgi:hypothetical protein|nr:hypothetical protein [Roseovarius sp.]